MALETFSKTEYGTWNRTYNNGSYYVSDSGRNRTYEMTGRRSSIRTPGFHNPNRVGRLKPNPFLYQLEEHWPLTGSQQRRTPGLVSGQGGFYYLNVLGPQGTIPYYGYSVRTSAPSSLRSRATNNLLDKIKGMNGNLAELFAERAKTADMVGTTAMNLVGAMVRLRQGNFAAAAAHLGVPPKRRAASRFTRDYAKRGAKSVANGWLALQYGWLPLLEDVHASCEALAQRNIGPMYVTSKVKKRLIEPVKTVNRVYDGGTHYTTERVNGKLETTLQISVTYYKSPSPASALSKLGITNPALLAWELVPYSFVIDWFLPIGQWIGAFDATLDLTFQSGYETVFSKFQASYEKTQQGKISNYVDDWYAYARTNQVYCERKVLTGFPSPCIPAFKNPLSLKHMANGLALLTSTFRK